MKDLQAELEINAEDCSLIARLAADKKKRETFHRLSAQLREMAAELEVEIAARLRMLPESSPGASTGN